MTRLDKIFSNMIEYYSSDPKRIQHFVKVHAFAQKIAEGEGLDEKTTELIEAVAYVHDIGIKPSEEKYHSSAGNYQQTEGRKPAIDMLIECGYDEQTADRAGFVVGHHHTYKNVEGIDWQIILEADFLVNAYEDNLEKDSIVKFREQVFRTKTGTVLLDKMFGLN